MKRASRARLVKSQRQVRDSQRQYQNTAIGYPHETYPSTTTYDREYLTKSDAYDFDVGRLVPKQPHPPTSPHRPDRRTPPRSPRPQGLFSYAKAGYVTKEEHERILKKNGKLVVELQQAMGSAGRAEKALRDLADWSYKERERLIGSQKEQVETAVRVKQAVMLQQGVLYIERKMNEMRTEVGLPKLSPAELNVIMEARFGGLFKGDAAAGNEGAGNSLLDVVIDEHIAAQVEELIAEEKDYLTFSE
jgi:hypothetical protein